MTRLPWPEKENPIISIMYELMTGFDKDNNPVYRQGSIHDDRELQVVQHILEALQPSQATVTSVTMGKVNLRLSNGELITLKPVFHPSFNVYKDIFKVDHFDFDMPALLADLLNKWRSQISDIRENPPEL